MFAVSLNNLIGGRQQRFRDGEAERISGRQIDYQFELGGLHDRQIGGPGALEDAACIGADLTKAVCEVGSVAHQPTGLDIFTHRITRWNPVTYRQDDKLQGTNEEESVSSDEECVGAIARKGG